MYYSWDAGRAEDHINLLCDQVKDVEILKYKKSLNLSNIPVHRAYEMNAVHVYIDILNLDEMLVEAEGGSETERSHKRALRFFDSHFRAIRFVLDKTNTIFVDFHNQRLHAVIPRPYGEDEDEQRRLDRAIAISNLIISVIKEQRSVNGDENIPAAKVRVGIDTGMALAVNNGRKQNKEPLFLGNPANHAAKHAYGKKSGIFLTEKAREILKLGLVDDTKLTSLTSEEINTSVERANLDNEVVAQDVIDEVCNNVKLLRDFQFSRAQTPLQKNLDFASLYYKSIKRQEMLSIYADIDGFTKYVSENIESEEGKKNILRCLHVVRSEMDDCLFRDFKGRRVRFIGDCMHGLICEGTTAVTDFGKTVDVGTEAVSGIRSSFNLALENLKERFNINTSSLGLGIGYEIGNVSNTRVGKKTECTRCSLGISTINSEIEQMSCSDPTETKIGSKAYEYLSSDYQNLFDGRSAKDLTFEKIEEANSEINKADESKSIYDSIDSSLILSNVKPHATIK